MGVHWQPNRCRHPLFLKIRRKSRVKFCKTESGDDRDVRKPNQAPNRVASAAFYPADRPFAPLRARAAALARMRSIWPFGRVRQISPIHSSFTPLIGLALKLVRLTWAADLPRSMVFR